MKNIVFDLGGVVFARDPQKCSEELYSFFSFIRQERLPHFWIEYDRGTWTQQEVKAELCRLTGVTPEHCDALIRESIALQEPVAATEALIHDLKKAGYRLYVLSNMSREFIAFLRKQSVYQLFDGEVVSCEEQVVKPEPRIYELLLERYGLSAAESLFIDDRLANVEAARTVGLAGFHFNAHNPAESCAALREMLL